MPAKDPAEEDARCPNPCPLEMAGDSRCPRIYARAPKLPCGDCLIWTEPAEDDLENRILSFMQRKDCSRRMAILAVTNPESEERKRALESLNARAGHTDAPEKSAPATETKFAQKHPPAVTLPDREAYQLSLQDWTQKEIAENFNAREEKAFQKQGPYSQYKVSRMIRRAKALAEYKGFESSAGPRARTYASPEDPRGARTDKSRPAAKSLRKAEQD